jgi:hypothetical protein
MNVATSAPFGANQNTRAHGRIIGAIRSFATATDPVEKLLIFIGRNNDALGESVE